MDYIITAFFFFFIHIAVATLFFFFLGSLWFSGLFRAAWTQELAHHNIIIKEPTRSDLYTKMGLTLLANFLVCFALACLVHWTNSATLLSGLMLGVVVAAIAAAVIGAVFVWENKSFKLFLIDAGYPVVGIILAIILLSVWR